MNSRPSSRVECAQALRNIKSHWIFAVQLSIFLFLLVLTLVIFVYRTGFHGAALGTAAVAAIGGIFTARGRGLIAECDPSASLHVAHSEFTASSSAAGAPITQAVA